MALEDLRQRETIDLAGRAATVREDLIPELENRIKAAEENDDPEHTPQKLRDLRDRLKGQARACERTVQALCPVHDSVGDCPGVDCDHADGVFVIQELMTKEASMLQDDVSEQSLEVDYETEEVSGTPKQGYHRIRTLELSVIEAPDEMPTQHDRELGRNIYCVGELPDHVSSYLYECVMALNDTGEVEGVGNLSSYGLRSQTSADEQSPTSKTEDSTPNA